MIRRGFWLLAGATGGIMGYRRVASLGRQLSGTLASARGAAVPEPGPEHSPARQAPARQAGTRQAARRGTGAARRGLVRGTIRFTRDARGFSRDVREGMDLYLARHPGRGGPTLGASTGNDERVKDDR